MLPTAAVNTYLNTPRPRHEWRAATFQGEAVIGSFEYAAGASVATIANYYKADVAANTVTAVGSDTFDAQGNVTRSVAYVGRVHPTTLTAGQSSTANYTVRVLAPVGTADTTEREVLTFVGNEEITLPGGRATTCKLTSVVSSVVSGTASELWQEQVHLVPNVGMVKTYLKPTGAIFLFDRGQTYLTELASTNATLTYASAAAATAPTLTACAAMAAGQNLVVTASNTLEAGGARRSTQLSTFNLSPTLQIDRRSFVPDALNSVYHFDRTLGELQLRGIYIYSNGNVSSSESYGGHPDLTGVGLGQTLSYSETITRQPANVTVTTNDSFTFIGHEKVTTLAGTFDTCKVRFDYGANNSGGSEIYWMVPNVHWARLERITASGARTTRELVSR